MDQIEEYEKGWECSTYERNAKWIKILVGNFVGKRLLEDRYVDGVIILN
jgi:hypothetical protein